MMRLLALNTVLFVVFCISFLAALAVGDVSNSEASAYNIRIDPSKTAGVISPLLFGHNLESTRWAVYKGLSSQMLANRKFVGTSRIYNWKKTAARQRHCHIVRGRPDSNGVVAHWYPIGEGKDIWHRVDTEICFSAPQSQRIDLFAKDIKAGIGQSGISIKAGVDYSIHFWLRAKQHISATARLTDSSGNNVYTRKTHTTSVGQWHLLSVSIHSILDN